MNQLGRKSSNLLFVFALLGLAFVGFARASIDEIVKVDLESKLMDRKMSAYVYGPLGWNRDNVKDLPTVYLLHGLSGRFSDWVEQGAATRLAKKHNVLIVMPEGENGWYVDSATTKKANYESYIVKELIPYVRKNFPSSEKREANVIAGLSMGGYGALKYGLKYPELFVVAGSFSGALKAPEWDDKTVPGWPLLGRSIMAAYGPKGSSTRTANDLFQLVNKVDSKSVGELPFFYIDCGTEDPLVTQNRDFAELLRKKRIPHEYRQLPGAHDWKYWSKQIMAFGLVLNEKIDRPL